MLALQALLEMVYTLWRSLFKHFLLPGSCSHCVTSLPHASPIVPTASPPRSAGPLTPLGVCRTLPRPWCRRHGAMPPTDWGSPFNS